MAYHQELGGPFFLTQQEYFNSFESLSLALKMLSSSEASYVARNRRSPLVTCGRYNLDVS